MLLAKAVLPLPLIVACARPIDSREAATRTQPARAHATEPSTDTRTRAEPPIRWSEDTHSPNPASVPAELDALAAECGEVDSRLNAAAAWLATLGPVGRSDDDIDRLRFALRASGVPYVAPLAWTRTNRGARGTAADEVAARAFASWLGTTRAGAYRRCGLARIERNGEQLTLVLVTQAPADLVKPLPIRAKVGQWLELRAELRMPATAAKVVLLGPKLDPWTAPTEQTGHQVLARFPAASPGRWEIQLVADGTHGPQQMLEAVLLVDVAAPSVHSPEPAPGEDVPLQPDTAPDVAIASMLAALRTRVGRPKLLRDVQLDRLAAAHAESMLLARRIGHDVGAGTTKERLDAAYFEARLAGENVAHASDPRRVHRALWASPSHRSNLLERRFSRWGLGVAIDTDDSLWVCELFASDP